MHHTSERIEEFFIHDGAVQSILSDCNAISLRVSFAYIKKEHPANPHNRDQCIGPCTMTFYGISSEHSAIWSDDSKAYQAHPNPKSPISGEIIKFKVTPNDVGYLVEMAGFYDISEWVEWRFSCKEVAIEWAEFMHNAWYES